MITVSIVSHGQGALVAQLLQDMRTYCATTPLRVLLTLNIEEHLLFDVADFSFEILIISNRERRGFAANHNAAFTQARGEYFCVLNPDIRLDSDPFPALVAGLSDATVGVVGPLVLGPEGQVEDSARRFPTLPGIAYKLFGSTQGLDYVIAQTPIYPDWIAGMFMLWRADAFGALGGFDEGYFLYYEDVDICARLRLIGLRVLLTPTARVTHYARRGSHRNFRYMIWHLKSMTRFLLRRMTRRI